MSESHPGEAPYRAPWSPLLWIMSGLGTAICLGVAMVLLGATGQGSGPVNIWIALLLAVLVIGSALFTVRSYSFNGRTLLIGRLLWSTRVPLFGLISATAEENAMRGSLRTFGNGGMFSFTGWYWSCRLGRYRAYVTHQRRTVVLRWSNRVILVSPERADEFARHAISAARS